MLVSEVAAEREYAAAAHGGQRSNLEAVLIELHAAIHAAESVGQLLDGERGILKVDVTAEIGIHQRAAGDHLEGGAAAGGEVAIKGLGQLEIDGAGGAEVKLMRLAQRERTLGVQIGLSAGQMQGIEMKIGVVEGGVKARVAAQIDAFKREGERIEARLAAQIVGVRERTVKGYGTGERGAGFEALQMSQLEELADVEVREIDLGVRGEVAGERGLAMGR